MQGPTAGPASAAPPLPRYGERSLAEVVPSLLGALGVAEATDHLELGPASCGCVLVIDGLGWQSLLEHPDQAPFLADAAAVRPPLTAGFPSTTAASLSSIGTGLPPGEHGLVGYTMSIPGHDRAMNLLLWELYGHGERVDLREELPPERLQPLSTAFQRAAAAGLAVSLVGPRQHAHTGLTRASLRGGRYRAAFGLGDTVAEAVTALAARPGSLVYAYHADLDIIGHVRGVDSDAWRLQLAHVDRLAAALAERLPSGAVLVVTGDHGMIDVAGERLDVGDHPALLEGVRLLAGEPRARHVHAVDGAHADVLAAWREGLGERMWVVGREEAIATGWFGPAVLDRVRPRIGDVVAASRTTLAVTQRAVDPRLAGLLAHHGSMLPGEQFVPLVMVRG